MPRRRRWHRNAIGGEVQQGVTKVDSAKVLSVDPTNPPHSDATCAADRSSESHVSTYSGVREVDQNGNSVTLPSRPTYFVESLTVVNISYPSATGWRVSQATNKGASTCAGLTVLAIMAMTTIGLAKFAVSGSATLRVAR